MRYHLPAQAAPFQRVVELGVVSSYGFNHLW
jgi:hypothetical protein